MNGFQTHHGLQAFISRLDHEVNICRKEQPFVIRPAASTTNASGPAITAAATASSSSMMDTTSEEPEEAPKEGDAMSTNMTIDDHLDDVDSNKEYLTGMSAPYSFNSVQSKNGYPQNLDV